MTSWRRWWLFFVFLAAMVGLMERAASAQSVAVAWDPNPDPSVLGYVVYVGTSSGEYTTAFDVGSANWFVYDVVPEQSYFFAVASYAEGNLVGPLSPEVSASKHAGVVLSNPGDQIAILGEPAGLQLLGQGSWGVALTFSAEGVPPGLAVDPSNGVITGTPTVVGRYLVTVTASDGALSDSQSFTWTIVPPAVDVTAPAPTITDVGTPDPWAPYGYVLITGTAVDDVDVNTVTWTNDRGGSGTAYGTDPWSALIMLEPGLNMITVTATDSAGNAGTAVIFLYR